MPKPPSSSAVQMLKIHDTCWGQFGGSGGSPRVFYAQTVASPSGDGSPQSELAEMLVPVREIIRVDKLNFDQILQRDLDDHRVVTDLIPYLLNSKALPRFFPPVLAVIVPFGHNEVADSYGELTELPSTPYSEGWDRHTWAFGDLFRFTRLYEKETGTYARSANIELNRQKAKLMVVDGQHRAMAILAIQRNLLQRWDRSEGRDYKHFYDEVDLGMLDQAHLEQIELPVCVCFFPDAVAGGTIPKLTEICRRIFLDVNREARQPSESRNILMDDYDLRAIFTRSVFSMAKNGRSTSTQAEGTAGHGDRTSLRLRHLEYDNPRDRIQVRKGVALSNVRTIEAAIEYLLVRSDDYFQNLSKSPSRGRKKSNNERLRRALRLEDVVSSSQLASWGLTSVEALTVDRFPPAARKLLCEQFEKTWGSLIVRFLSNYQPFQYHISAVEIVHEQARVSEDEGQLARRALFEGQGLYFTLEAHAATWRDQGSAKAGVTPHAVLAWDKIERWNKRIEELRAADLLKVKDVNELTVKVSNRIFSVLRTQAFQIGALMALGYLAEQHKVGPDDPVLDVWIQAASTTWDFIGVYERLFDKDSDGLFALYPGTLSPTSWPIFRHIFLEQVLKGLEEENAVVREACAHGRRELCKTLANTLVTRAKREGKDLSEAKARTEARELVRKAMKRSFNVTKSNFDSSLNTGINPSEAAHDDEIDDEIDGEEDA